MCLAKLIDFPEERKMRRFSRYSFSNVQIERWHGGGILFRQVDQSTTMCCTCSWVPLICLRLQRHHIDFLSQDLFWMSKQSTHVQNYSHLWKQYDASDVQHSHCVHDVHHPEVCLPGLPSTQRVETLPFQSSLLEGSLTGNLENNEVFPVLILLLVSHRKAV